MQLHTYVEARLGRWYLWHRWGPYPGPKSVISWWGPMIIEPNVEQIGRPSTTCPVDIDEAEETQRSVMALLAVDDDLYKVIVQAYLRGGTIEQKIRALGCKSNKTYYNRLERAYVKLLGFFNDAGAGVPLPRPKFDRVPTGDRFMGMSLRITPSALKIA
jgi:hypothetical protein